MNFNRDWVHNCLTTHLFVDIGGICDLDLEGIRSNVLSIRGFITREIHRSKVYDRCKIVIVDTCTLTNGYVILKSGILDFIGANLVSVAV